MFCTTVRRFAAAIVAGTLALPVGCAGGGTVTLRDGTVGAKGRTVAVALSPAFDIADAPLVFAGDLDSSGVREGQYRHGLVVGDLFFMYHVGVKTGAFGIEGPDGSRVVAYTDMGFTPDDGPYRMVVTLTDAGEGNYKAAVRVTGLGKSNAGHVFAHSVSIAASRFAARRNDVNFVEVSPYYPPEAGDAAKRGDAAVGRFGPRGLIGSFGVRCVGGGLSTAFANVSASRAAGQVRRKPATRPVGAADGPRRPVRIRVLTYNIHHGAGEDGKIDLPRLARVILAARPDIVALQEVDRKTRRVGGVNQARQLGRLTKMHAVFGNAMAFSGGHYGQAILSRWEVLDATAYRLVHDKGAEPRAAVAVRVRAGAGGPLLQFAGTHLDHQRHSLRLRQARQLNALFVKAAAGATILAGDLNATPDSKAIAALRRHWMPVAGPNAAPTWPSRKPRQKIDYILFRPAAGWRIVEARVLDEKLASDHRPLLAVLEWRPGPQVK